MTQTHVPRAANRLAVEVCQATIDSAVLSHHRHRTPSSVMTHPTAMAPHVGPTAM
jgi:hypothetical protein